MLTPVQAAAQMLSQAKEDVLLVLRGHEHEMIVISCVSGLTAIINKLNFMSGQTPSIQYKAEFLAVTDFFGDPIHRTKEIVREDLQPTLSEKELFLLKIDALQSTFRERQPETLIHDFSNAEDQLILRGLAIRAGLEDAREAIVGIDFIERVKAALNDKDLRAAEEDAIDNKLSGLSQSGAGSNDPLSTIGKPKVVKTTKPTAE